MTVAEKIRSRLDRLYKVGSESYSFESECYSLCMYIGWATRFHEITIEESNSFASELTDLIMEARI